MADGFKALLSNTTGSTNTADGYEALLSNTGGNANTAEGSYALYANNGTNNTATVRDEKGQVFTVRYEAVNAMLLNEFLKEHQRVQELQTRLDSLAAQMKEQARAIEDVSKKMVNEGAATEQLTSCQMVRAE